MRRTSTGPDRRGGFTLVELLVVITIIAILVALTSAAVVKALGKSDEVRTRNEISQLQAAVQAFKTDFQVAYIPDKLVLPPGNDVASAQYISSLWPRIGAGTVMPGTNTPTTNGPLSTGNGPFAFSPTGPAYTPYTYWGVPGTQPIVLQGYQTIVFFLGGARDSTGNPVGFSASATDPMNTSGTLGAATRKGPYFEFPSNRLQVLMSDSQNNKSPFPAFIDIYGTMPYLYFSSAKAGNDYTNYSATNPPGPQAGATASGVSFSVLPFQISSARYVNPNGFQIISAGKDTTFGTGGTNWTGYPGGSTSLNGYDDVANFHPTLLGIAAQ